MSRGQETTKELVSIGGEMRFFSGRWGRIREHCRERGGRNRMGRDSRAECVCVVGGVRIKPNQVWIIS